MSTKAAKPTTKAVAKKASAPASKPAAASKNAAAPSKTTSTTTTTAASKKTAAPAKGAASKAVPIAQKVTALKEHAAKVTAAKQTQQQQSKPAVNNSNNKASSTKLLNAAAHKKIVKANGRKPSQLETNVVRALVDIENTSSDLKADLRQLHFVSAKEISVSKDGKRAVVIFVPYRLLQQYHKIQARLIRELEKKFSGKQVVIIAQRRILPKPNRNNHIKVQQRPRSRTLTAVHDAILEDLVYPTEIVGKRLRYKIDGSRLFKILLDRKDKPNLEHKLHTFATVYKRLTGKEAQFTFPIVKEAPSFAFKA